MQVKIEELKKSFGEALTSANSAEALEALRVEYLGKKGHVAELMTQLRFAEDKKAAGQLINGLKVYCEGEIERATEELRAAAIAAKVRSAKKYNPTLIRPEELGSYHPITLATREVEEVFRKRALEAGAPIAFAQEEVLKESLQGRLYGELKGKDMDLKGACQEKNIKTVCTAVGILEGMFDVTGVEENICRAAGITGLRGRWETLSCEPFVVCDTGHNAHGFSVLGPQLHSAVQEWLKNHPQGKFHMVFGVVADKDLDSIVEFLPVDAHYHFVKARGTRALPAGKLAMKMAACGFDGEAVEEDIVGFLKKEPFGKEDFVFVGGSTFVVAEAIEFFDADN